MLIDLYGVRKHLDIYQSLPPPEVNRVLNQSKVNLILSLREGANKSVFEGFFADVLGIVLRHNIGINKSHINEYTGRLIDERELPQVLLWFREHYRDFRPREWAMQNISPHATTAKLERHFAGDCLRTWRTVDARHRGKKQLPKSDVLPRRFGGCRISYCGRYPRTVWA